jgi:hypothetical protein
MPSAADPAKKICSKAVFHPLRCMRGGHGGSPSSLFTDAKLYGELDGNTRVSMQPPKTRGQPDTLTAWEWSTGNPWRFRDGLPLVLKVLEPCMRSPQTMEQS